MIFLLQTLILLFVVINSSSNLLEGKYLEIFDMNVEVTVTYLLLHEHLD